MGPFTRIPFKNYVQSPVGLVPKAGNQTRLIFHLSYVFGDNGSVNSYTPQEKCTVQYKDLDFAVKEALHLIEAAISNQEFVTVWFGKTDIKSAFRLLPLGP